MKTAFVTLLLVITAISFSGQAQTQVQTQTHRTHFQTLRQAFLEASVPARIQDFESHRWDRCLYVDINSQQTLQETKVRTVRMHAPGGGPLFPGGTHERADVFQDPVIDRYMYSFFQSSYEASNAKHFLQVLDGAGWVRMNLYAKKARGVLLFHVATSAFLGHNTVMDPRVFGYCWNERRERPEPPRTPRPPKDPRPLPPPETAPRPQPPEPSPVPVPLSEEDAELPLPLPLPAPPAYEAAK